MRGIFSATSCAEFCSFVLKAVLLHSCSNYRNPVDGTCNETGCVHILWHVQRKNSHHSVLRHRFLYRLFLTYPELHWTVDNDLHKVALQPTPRVR